MSGCLCCIARSARVGPGHLRGLLSVLNEAMPDAQRDDAARLAEMLGFGLDIVLRMLDALYDAGAIDGANRVIGNVQRHRDAVTRGDAMVTPGDDPVMLRRRLLGRERQRRWRLKQRESAANVLAAASVTVAAFGDASPAPSLSLFPESEQAKENKQTRARGDAGDDNGFAELAGMWPLQNRMLDAEREYRRALRVIDRSRLIELAQRYLDELGTRYCMFLANWLHTQPWRDPLLPLASRPVEVIQVEPKEPRIEWRSHAESWLARGIWPPDIGPPPDDPECRMPEGLHQTTLQRARRQHERERVYG